MSSDSSSDEFSDNSPNKAGLLWSQIADKFRCLLINRSPSAIVEFLETFLTFIRKRPSDSRDFTGSICRYLFATKILISKTPEVDQYYGSLRQILMIYCVLELRLIDCFDDETVVASDILFKIIMLMQGSTSMTVLDVLIDINEHIRSSLSKSVMALVYRYYLTRNPTGEQRVLDDTDYVKHLILYRSWYNAEAMSDKISVFKWFTSTIKPTEELRSNQFYSLLNIGEVIDYKNLLQQSLPRNALIRAVRDAENNDDNDANIVSLDLTMDEEPAIKVEVDDDDDIDTITISYLPNLFQRLDAIDESEKRIERLSALHNNAPSETFVISSDSEADCEDEQSIMADANEDNVSWLDDSTVQLSSGTCRRNNVKIKICNRKKKPKRRNSLHTKNHHRMTGNLPSTNRKKKSVTFSNPLVTTHMFQSYTDANDAIDTDLFSDNVTGTPSALSDMSTSVDVQSHSSSQTGYSGRRCENRKSRGKKRSVFGVKQRKTSIDDWIKRKRLTTKEFVVSGNAGIKPKKCRLTLTRLDGPEQILRMKSAATNEMRPEIIDSIDEDVTSNLVEAKQQQSEATTRYCMSPSSTSSKSVFETVWIASPMQSTENRRVLLPITVTSHRNGPELGLQKCVIRLKRLKPDLKPKAKSPKPISAVISGVNSRLSTKSQYQRQFECSIGKSREVQSPSIPAEKCITKNSTTASSPPQLLPSSETNDKNDLPSPVYSPLRKRILYEHSKPEFTTKHPSAVINGQNSDTDEIPVKWGKTVRVKCDKFFESSQLSCGEYF